MNDIKFIKNIDNLGRIVIPMDVRRKLQINTGDVLSIKCENNNIMLTKYSTLDNNMKIIEQLKIFVECFGVKLILVNKDSVIYSNVVDICDVINKDLKSLVVNGTTLRNQLMDMYFSSKKINGVYNMLPIVTNEGIVGSIIVFGDINERGFEICTLIQKIILLELNIS